MEFNKEIEKLQSEIEILKNECKEVHKERQRLSLLRKITYTHTIFVNGSIDYSEYFTECMDLIKKHEDNI